MRGEPNEAQLGTLDLINASEPDQAKVIGWYDEFDGPLVVREDGRWQVILQTGRIKTLARSWTE